MASFNASFLSMASCQMRHAKRKPELTPDEILALPEGRYYRGMGLVLIVTATSRRWAFRYRSPVTHRWTETSIGPWPSYSYADAHNSAMGFQWKINKGQDPVVEKRRKRAIGTTLQQAYEERIKKRRSKWRSVDHLDNMLKHVRSLANKPIASITTPMIVKVLSPLWEEHPEQARRTLSMLARVFGYAKSMDYCTGDNPAEWRDNMENIFPDRPKNHDKHYRSMPFKQVPEFVVHRLRPREVKGNSAAALEFQILTAARPGEVRNMKWSQVDLINRVWTLQPEQTKQNRQHRVPFPIRCMEILAFMNEYRTGDFVFPGYGGETLNPTAVDTLLRKMGVNTTPHGFRSSFRNWGAHAGYDRDLLEICLGHKVAGKTEGAYWTDDMLEQRRPIMEAWATHCG